MARRLPVEWTPEMVTQLRALTADPSKDWVAVGEALGVTEQAARHKAMRLGINKGGPSRLLHDRPIAPLTPEAAAEPFQAALAGLQPIRLPAPAKPTGKRSASDTTIVAGDFHAPLTDPECEDILLQVITDLRPRRLVLNGDTVDLLAVSKYPKDVRHTWDLLDERVSWHKTLKRLHDAMAPHGGEIVETEANHSGNGTESRWWRFLSDRIGPLASLPDVVEKLSYQSVWWPEWHRMTLVGHWEITPGFVAIHGDIARKQAGYSANAMLTKWRGSLIHNHTHRMGFTGNRLPAFGSRPEDDLAAYENGCMCRLDCFYTTAPDWQQGFAIVRHDDVGNYNVEQVRIRKGQALVGGLGGTYRAAA